MIPAMETLETGAVGEKMDKILPALDAGGALLQSGLLCAWISPRLGPHGKCRFIASPVIRRYDEPMGKKFLIVVVLVSLASKAPADDTIYVSSAGGNFIEKLTTSGAATTFASSGLSGPEGLAVDSNGNLFVANFNSNVINEFDSGGTSTVFAQGGLQDRGAMARDTNGNLYISNTNQASIEKITPNGAISVFANNLVNPYGIAVDKMGNVYVAIQENNEILKFTPDGNPSVFYNQGPTYTPNSPLLHPSGLAFDSSGNLYVANHDADWIEEFTPDGTPSRFAVSADLDVCIGLAFDSTGNLYATNSGGVVKITPNGVVSPFWFLPGDDTTSYIAIAAPEPSTLALLALGAIGSFSVRRRIR